MKTCEVLDLTKSGKVVYSQSLAVLEVHGMVWFNHVFL